MAVVPPVTPFWPASPAFVLAEWEATAAPAHLTAQAPHRPAVLNWLTALHQLLLSAPLLPINVDMDDVATVIRGAGAIRTAQTDTTGLTRAGEALRQLLAALPAFVDGQPARHALLSIVSGPAAPLKMDELSEITETIHSALLHDEGEMIFGHGERATGAAGGLQVWLLLGYQA